MHSLEIERSWCVTISYHMKPLSTVEWESAGGKEGRGT